MNMVGYFFHKKKKTEKNTQACLWNMRGSLPLLNLKYWEDYNHKILKNSKEPLCKAKVFINLEKNQKYDVYV